MNKPKTQADLLKIIENQEKDIKKLKQAVARLETQLRQTVLVVRRNKETNRRLTGNVGNIEKNLQRLNVKLND